MRGRIAPILVSLNPLAVRGRSVPPPLVVVARFLALALVLLPERPFGRFLPHLAWLDDLGSFAAFASALHSAAAVGTVLVLIGPLVRTGALLLGGAYLTGLLACRPCQSVAHTFVACVFLMVALSSRRTGTALLRWQVVVVYVGATAAKVFDRDWWDGRYMETLLDGHALYEWAGSAGVSTEPVSLVLSLGTIAVEGAIVVCLARRAWWTAGIALGVLFHGSMVLFLGQTFGPFLCAILISYVAFLRWPGTVEVAVRRGPAWSAVRRLFAMLDSDRTFRVRPDPPARGLVRADVHGTPHRGLAAVVSIALYSPVAYVLAAFALTVAGEAVRSAVLLVLIGAVLALLPSIRASIGRARRRPGWTADASSGSLGGLDTPPMERTTP